MAWLPFQKWRCHDDLAVTVNDAAPWTEESDIDNSLSGNFEDIVNEAIVEAAIYQEDIEPDAIEPEACDPEERPSYSEQVESHLMLYKCFS